VGDASERDADRGGGAGGRDGGSAEAAARRALSCIAPLDDPRRAGYSPPVERERKLLAALNVAGGIAVLASYAWGVALAPALRTGLWGGVPESLRGLYTANMLLAAAGYFPFTYALLFATTPDRFRREARAPYRVLHLLYALVLGPSALWLPLTAAMIEAPSEALWLAIRAVLAAVAVGALGLLALLVRVARARRDALGWSAVAGAVPFVTQTAILDALVWPAYWRG
jgi:hypothetical protein